MEWPFEECANCGAVLWHDDPEFEGYHCRKCGEWYYPDQLPEEASAIEADSRSDHEKSL